MIRTGLARRAVLGVLLAAASGAWAQRDARQSFALQVPSAPTPVTIGGQARLVYELHLTSFAAEPLRLARIAVLDEASAATLAEFRGETLAALLGRPGLEKGGDRSVVAPGLGAVAYLDVPFDASRAGALRHRIDFESVPSGAAGRVEGGRTTPRPPAPARLGPPLRDGPWAAIYGAAWERGHRRVLYAVDGQARIPGRFAIDWVKLDADGRSFAGDGRQPADWYGYGADVLAVADATVAALRDDVPEPSAVTDGGRRVPIGDASGNYVALKLADGRYAFYEHLKPGSIRVRPGTQVRRGETIAALGYTGESTGPHLHFHLADAPLPLAAEGLPYAFEAWRPLGAYASIEAFARAERWTPAKDDAPPTVAGEFPAPLAVIEFADPAREAGQAAVRR
jgi:hypothetical protein